MQATVMTLPKIQQDGGTGTPAAPRHGAAPCARAWSKL